MSYPDWSSWIAKGASIDAAHSVHQKLEMSVHFEIETNCKAAVGAAELGIKDWRQVGGDK
jgi:hypothetical protein